MHRGMEDGSNLHFSFCRRSAASRVRSQRDLQVAKFVLRLESLRAIFRLGCVGVDNGISVMRTSLAVFIDIMLVPNTRVE